MKPRFGVIGVIILTAVIVMSLPALPGETGRIKVAAVQMANLDGDYAKCREVAQRLIIEAVEQDAKVIVLPEFALIGYTYRDDVWETAEPLDGPTTRWMKDLCRRYNIYLGLCILEVKGDDFYDTFVLAGPGEGELWTHRKIEPALYEARYFKGAGVNPAVFETPLGRIGVSICYDNSKTHTINNLLQEQPDLLLMTFSAPEIPIVPETMGRVMIDSQNETPVIYAQVLDVPVVLCNKTGPWNSPLPGIPGVKLHSDFVARSRIVSADGEVLASLQKQEAVVVAEVEIRSEHQPDPGAVPEGRWLTMDDPLMRSFSDLTYRISEIRYRSSPARKRAVEAAKQSPR